MQARGCLPRCFEFLCNSENAVQVFFADRLLRMYRCDQKLVVIAAVQTNDHVIQTLQFVFRLRDVVARIDCVLHEVAEVWPHERNPLAPYQPFPSVLDEAGQISVGALNLFNAHPPFLREVRKRRNAFVHPRLDGRGEVGRPPRGIFFIARDWRKGSL